MSAHILIIDDEEAITKSLGRFFKKSGFMVSTASNGEEGLRLFDTELIDLVITDMLMPEVDGLEVIREIKQERARKIPVIGMSGEISDELVDIPLLPISPLLGVDFTFQKPIPNNDLLNKVKELLELYK
ncbi:MAG: response regulator [Magnetococcales bacterium]|nr:response regulator [Magnetococcales bacterium]